MREHGLYILLAPVVGRCAVLLIRALILRICAFSKNQRFAGDR